MRGSFIGESDSIGDTLRAGDPVQVVRAGRVVALGSICPATGDVIVTVLHVAMLSSDCIVVPMPREPRLRRGRKPRKVTHGG